MKYQELNECPKARAKEILRKYREKIDKLNKAELQELEYKNGN